MRKYLRIILGLSIVMLFTACGKEEDPLESFRNYKTAFAALDYEGMYENLSTQSREAMTMEEFTKSFGTIYPELFVESGTLTEKLDETEMNNKTREADTAVIPVTLALGTAFGEDSYSFDLTLVREIEGGRGKGQFRVDFTPKLVLENYEAGDRIKVTSVAPERGRILDRNAKVLAGTGEAVLVGIVPGRLGVMKEEIVKDLSEALGISVDYINGRLSLTWVKDDTFVDLKKIPKEQQGIIEAINAKNAGATFRVVKERFYPYREAAAPLTGYLGAVNEEELKVLKPLGFNENTKVGRVGLEKQFEEQLRGAFGRKVNLVSASGQVKETLFEEPVANGTDVTLTIDIDKQAALYETLKGEKGTASVMDYVTGEIHALVSSPSYDPNRFILGMTQDEYNALTQDPANPLLNRAAKVYPPGSVIKPVTTAIALEKISFDETFSIMVTGKDWQKDASWGGYFVTRVTDPGVPVDLEKAFIYSDNIYFAQMALRLGAERFLQGAGDFGIGKPLSLGIPMETSQLAGGNVITKEVLLADTGYGQGEVLVNIVNIVKAYSVMANKGRITEPVLVLGEAAKEGTVLISEEAAAQIMGYMRKVIEDPDGTGSDSYIPGRALAGKTGTAEINTAQAGSNRELGWFAVIDGSGGNSLITAMMVEDVQGRGGSHLVVPMVRAFIQDYR
jgi:penicillin-binding protein